MFSFTSCRQSVCKTWHQDVEGKPAKEVWCFGWGSAKKPWVLVFMWMYHRPRHCCGPCNPFMTIIFFISSGVFIRIMWPVWLQKLPTNCSRNMTRWLGLQISQCQSSIQKPPPPFFVPWFLQTGTLSMADFDLNIKYFFFNFFYRFWLSINLSAGCTRAPYTMFFAWSWSSMHSVLFWHVCCFPCQCQLSVGW